MSGNLKHAEVRKSFSKITQSMRHTNKIYQVGTAQLIDVDGAELLEGLLFLRTPGHFAETSAGYISPRAAGFQWQFA